jgi:hypothetical protein
MIVNGYERVNCLLVGQGKARTVNWSDRRRGYVEIEEPPNGLRQPPPGESHGVDGYAVGHCTGWKIAQTRRSAARICWAAVPTTLRVKMRAYAFS